MDEGAGKSWIDDRCTGLVRLRSGKYGDLWGYTSDWQFGSGEPGLFVRNAERYRLSCDHAATGPDCPSQSSCSRAPDFHC
jgi:hypothetical protein